MKFRAKVSCQFEKRFYRAGSIMEYSGEIKECDCRGKDKKCKLCKGSGRLVPPHHFDPIDRAKEVKESEEKAKSESEEMDEIRAEMDSIGAAYDRRWKLPKMKDALIAAKREGKTKE